MSRAAADGKSKAERNVGRSHDNNGRSRGRAIAVRAWAARSARAIAARVAWASVDAARTFGTAGRGAEKDEENREHGQKSKHYRPVPFDKLQSVTHLDAFQIEYSDRSFSI